MCDGDTQGLIAPRQALQIQVLPAKGRLNRKSQLEKLLEVRLREQGRHCICQMFQADTTHQRQVSC